MIYTTSSDFYESNQSTIDSFFRNLINMISGLFSRFSFETDNIIFILVSVLVVVSVIILGVRLVKSFSE